MDRIVWWTYGLFVGQHGCLSAHVARCRSQDSGLLRQSDDFSLTCGTIGAGPKAVRLPLLCAESFLYGPGAGHHAKLRGNLLLPLPRRGIRRNWHCASVTSASAG
jgi:hypothetical protein